MTTRGAPSNNGDFDATYLKSILDYYPDTGIFIWRYCPRSDFIGKVAGAVHHSGYTYITIIGKRYSAHRLAWFYMTGAWPEHEVDHINCIRNDNRWCNLREATPSQNMGNTPARINNVTGLKGAYYRKDSNKYRAQIRIDGKFVNLGNFDTAEEAHEAYCKAAPQLYKEFARYE